MSNRTYCRLILFPRFFLYKVATIYWPVIGFWAFAEPAGWITLEGP